MVQRDMKKAGTTTEGQDMTQPEQFAPSTVSAQAYRNLNKITIEGDHNCCTAPISQVGAAGVGLELYFRLILFFCVMFFILMIFAFPSY